MVDMLKDVSLFVDKLALRERFLVDPENGLMVRTSLIMEEALEFAVATKEDDLVAMADALVDVVYAALGTAISLNLPWDELWAEVQRANMEKELATANDNSDGKQRGQHNAVKPAGWRAPDLLPILERHWDKISGAVSTEFCCHYGAEVKHE